MENKILWVGIDVGAKSFCAAVDFPMVFKKQEKKDVSELPSREFKMTQAGVKSFFHWLELQQSEFWAEYASEEGEPLPVHLLMEATGSCSTQLEKLLCAIDTNVVVIISNPLPIKAFRTSLNIHNKTDKLDAQVIARYGLERNPEPRQKLSPELKNLREYSRARSFLKDQRTAFNNYHDNIDNSLPKRMCSNIVNQIDKEIEGLDREIDKIVKETPVIQHEIDIMTTMPGVGITSAVAILGELGSLKSYRTREQLIAMSGLNPIIKQSGISVNSARLSKKGSPVVRRFLYMDSTSALPRIPVLQELYDRLLTRGKTRMQARCAVMRKMLLLLRGMVKNDKIFSLETKKIEKDEKTA